MLEHARQRFLDSGYAATTVESIAHGAGISAATIYKTYGGKAGLIRELCARALAGEEAVPAETRSDALRAGDDPRRVIDGWGALAAEVSPRISPLVLLLRSAAESDDGAAALYDELEAPRLERMADNANFLVERGHVRHGVTTAEVRDVLWFCTAAETFDLLIVRRGWTPDRFGAFVASTIAGAVL